MDACERIVADYLKYEASRAADEEGWFGDPRMTLSQAIHRACLSKLPGRTGKLVMHSHQRRQGATRMAAVAQHLAGAEDPIRGSRSFDVLIRIVEKRIRPMPGVGALTVYDVATRIGDYLGLEPTEVFLHAGTREGAKALGVTGDGRTAQVADFPTAFQKLTPSQVEDCLCIYKGAIKAVISGNGYSPPRGATGCGVAPNFRTRC